MNCAHTRRDFLTQTGRTAFGAGLMMAARNVMGANEKVILGVIGCGGQGTADMNEFARFDHVEIAAVCDVDSDHLQNAQKECERRDRLRPKDFKDFRKLLEMREIDAVLIGAPDHWHAIPFIHACEAGKDIFCEKPLAQNFLETKAMLAAARKYKPVVQINTWQRSLPHFQEAIRFAGSGAMGKIVIARGWFNCPADGWLKPIGNQQPQNPPESLDWDFWLGPAPKVPYQSNRCHFNWRWFYDYGGCLMTDWGVHVLDIALLGMNDMAPREVHGVSGKLFMTDDRETADTQQCLYKFKDWFMYWETRLSNGRGLDGGIDHGAEFIGSRSTLIVDRKDIKFFPETAGVEKPKKMQGKSSMYPHVENFLDCVKSRKNTNSDVESMGLVTMICQLGNMASMTGKTILWDAEKQDIINKKDVEDCIAYWRPYREPWELPNHG
jgi:predicted dehydrogenase